MRAFADRNGILELMKVFLVLLVTLPFYGQNLEGESYRTGPIELIPLSDFGAMTDWNDYLYDGYCDLVEGPDGSIFVSSNRQHMIFKFDSHGRLVKTFGQYGQGPGDFNGPHGLSILDGSILVVGEYALSHRISLFDLEGNFVRLLKTKKSVYSPIALRDGKVAYVHKMNRRNDKESQLDITAEVIILDIENGSETVVVEETLVSHFETYGQMMTVGGLIDEGNLFLARDSEGNLIVGHSLRQVLNVYDLDGKKIRDIPLQIDPPIITKGYIRALNEARISIVERNSELDRDKKTEIIKRIRDTSPEYMAGRSLVGYDYLQTDRIGNILVFKKTDCVTDCPIPVQIYAPDGDFICETELVKGDFELELDFRWQTVYFSEKNLFALVELKDAPEYTLQLIKVGI